ncbi:xanthine dehydrogenase family protein molybdopterin-binding subunit [Calidifontibacillus oryziterrae]|uniref:xanthine dehydrogenase family protein molybdopterin-binding subunit n=1 Tax=Calidifontibacillus oryziterrae TaxID=1191699 RepID=UPI00031F89B4|nr:xanthine dehydrogenase family protein molybdopterin-binding subunit [Calidifontibacillus oryziterrae]
MPYVVGKPLKRKEDQKLITGHGHFTDDIKLPDMLYAAMKRSQYAHAKIKSVQVDEALKLPGVIAIYTGSDVQDKIKSIRSIWLVPGCDLIPKDRVPLATDKVNYVGEAVAMVIADSRYVAYDALDLIEVEYEELPAVVHQEEALEATAPTIYDDVPNNIAFTWKAGAVPEDIFVNADVVVKQRFYEQRVVANPMETRAAVAHFNPGSGELTLWCTTQNPHIHRMTYSDILGIPETKLRVIAPDMGGGFGAKIAVYTEEALVAFAAMDLKQPVKWIENRQEHFLATSHARDQVITTELAGTKDGKILAIRAKNIANLGAYLSTMGAGVPTIDFGLMITGAYTIPYAECETIGVYTNTTPTDAYRGAGKPEASYQIERIVNLYADKIGMDQVEVRRINLVPQGSFPYTNAMGCNYDSGDYQKVLRTALDTINYDELRKEQEEARKNGRLVGVGISTYVELCGLGPSKVAGAIGFGGGLWENSTIRVHPSGKVTIFTGASPHGQGEKTTFSQVVADKFGIPVEDIELVSGDTLINSMGWGTYGSRTTPVAGGALALAAERVVEKAKTIAAHELEVDVSDVDFNNGVFSVNGHPEKVRTFQEIAWSANNAWNLPEGVEPALEGQSFFDPPDFVYPFGAHICVVEVDQDTGMVKLKKYVCVDDVGRIINPLIVEGQIHGGIAQGIGQALWEQAVYSEKGQLLSGTFMDYAMPKASFFPMIESSFIESPSPVNALGVKGVGEAGTTAAPSAIVNAVIDALKPFGVVDLEMPLTPEKVWTAMQEGRNIK